MTEPLGAAATNWHKFFCAEAALNLFNNVSDIAKGDARVGLRAGYLRWTATFGEESLSLRVRSRPVVQIGMAFPEPEIHHFGHPAEPSQSELVTDLGRLGAVVLTGWSSRGAALAELSGSWSASIGSFWYPQRSAAEEIMLAFADTELDEDEQMPAHSVISGIAALTNDVWNEPGLKPRVSVFYGEAMVSWRRGDREVSLVSRAGRGDPKLLKYDAGAEGPSRQEVISPASGEQLRSAVRWLYA